MGVEIEGPREFGTAKGEMDGDPFAHLDFTAILDAIHLRIHRKPPRRLLIARPPEIIHLSISIKEREGMLSSPVMRCELSPLFITGKLWWLSRIFPFASSRRRHDVRIINERPGEINNTAVEI